MSYNEEEIEIIYFNKVPFVQGWKQKTGALKGFPGSFCKRVWIDKKLG